MQENAYRGRPVVSDAVFEEFNQFVARGIAAGAIDPEAVYAPQLRSLERTLRKSDQKAALASLTQLRRGLTEQAKADLRLHQADVRATLESAILVRYLPDSELRLLALTRDPQLNAAVAVVLDRERYAALLNPGTSADGGLSGGRATDSLVNSNPHI
jgi:hypothetical protein